MNLEWFRKRIGLMAFVGLILIFVGMAFMPFLRHAPRKDSNGHYLINPRTEERIYSNEAKEAYRDYWLGNLSVVTGLGMIIFIPIIIVFDRNRKKSSITQQTNHDRHPNEA